MLKYRLLHPEVLRGLGEAGHGAQILIADGNYPLLTRTHPGARRVYLNLAPGMVSVTDVLKVLTTAIPIEAALTMRADGGEEPPIPNFQSVLAAPSAPELADTGRLSGVAARHGAAVAGAIRVLRGGARPRPGPRNRYRGEPHLCQHPADDRCGRA